MNTRISGRLNKTNHPTTLTVVPVTRAIRAALAISFTLLGLGGTSVAFAQTCVATTATMETCEGAFTNTLPDSAFFTPVADLTLVLGDSTNSVPTSVIPAASVMGINANWTGKVGVTSYADITTVGATGLFAYGSTSATVNNSGAITTNVTAAGAKAMDVNAYGDVSVVNNGPINAYSTSVYDVTAVSAYSVNGKVTVDNQAAGTITATAQDGNAIALYASSFGNSIVSNEGAISAYSANGVAAGVIAYAFQGDASISNSGSISAKSGNYQAVGLIVSSVNGYATVANTGTVSATGGQDQSIGISSKGALGSSVDNSGSVYATSSQGGSTGLSAHTYSGTASVTNSGSIHSKNNGPYAAIGILATSVNGQASIDNAGFVQSINYHGEGIGLEADSATGSTIANSGYVLGGSYFANATGVLATAISGDVNVTSRASGYIRTVTRASKSYEAIGVSAHSTDGNVSVSNDGSILSLALYGKATGIQAFAGGDVSVENTGHTRADNAYYNDAMGISAQSFNGAVTVVNSGSIYGYSPVRLGHSATDRTTVDGIIAVNHAGTYDALTSTYGPTAMTTVVNSGYVNAVGAWFVNGIAAGSYGGTSVTNTQTGRVIAKGLNPIGIEVVESPNSIADHGFGAAIVNNAGSIRVDQVGNCYCGNINPFGYGIQVVSGFGGDIAVSNTGSIGVNTQHSGFGIFAYGFIGKTAETNAGSITISGSGANGSQLFGEDVRSAYGSVSASNSGDITIISAPVAGQLYAGNEAEGMYARAGRAGSKSAPGGGDAILVNTGQINIDSHVGYGMWTNSQYGVGQAYNAGTITLNDDFVAVGITAAAGNQIVPGVGSVLLDNTGSVSATASNQAIGLRAFTGGAVYGGYPGIAVAIDNSGYVGASSQQRSQGILASSSHEDTFTIDNSGSVVVNATVNNRTGQYVGASGSALGIHTANYAGGATVTNSGDITAVTHEDNQQAGAAVGIFTYNGSPTRYIEFLGIGYGDTSITNTGSISASLVSSNALQPVPLPPRTYFSQSVLFGPSNTASGILATNTYGDVAITNAGMITASAQSDHYTGGGSDNGVTTANGIAVASKVGTYNFTTVYSDVYNPVTGGYDKVYDGVASALTLGDIKLTNAAAGIITAYAKSTDASGDTALANGIAALVTIGNYGGSLVSAGSGITISNAGSVSATAVTGNDATGIAIANGISAINGSTAGFVHITNYGAITAAATSPGTAIATGIFAIGYSAAVALNAGGVINATATGSTGTATGLSLTNTGTGALKTNNDGVLMATFNGAGSATGATITSAGDIVLSNTGHILASNATSAVGVAFNSPTNVTLANSGTITANAAAAGSVAVLSTGASNAILTNSGTITGAIQTGAGNDSLTNAVGGVWNAVGSSDFGAGDDTVSNAGTIHLANTTISLGRDAAGNQFSNAGTVTVEGNNTITLVTGTSANPNAFTNTGTLNFQNGAANDTLTIAGNFAGSGQIAMDVDGAKGTADQLKITGNVAAGSVNVVNVNLLTDPTTASTTIPLVQVAGTAAAGSFKLGTFVQPKGFLGLSEALVSTSNAASLGLTVTPATVTTPPTPPPPSGVGIGVTVNGLSQLGTLAASAAPGVQSLLTSQIGTLQDRMGAVSQTIKGGLSLWTRAFANSGTVDPDHSAGNFGQNGNFGFDQSNTGEELGLDFAIADTIKAGALFAKSQANQSLDGNQADSSKITGNTSGIYGTYIDPSGLYVDVSYRWMSFNDRLHAPNGYASIHGNADAFNLEAGKTWVLQNGLQIAPQFQYTLTKVDNINAQTGGVAGFQSSGDDSSRARLGVMFSKTYTPAGSHALWMPYASLSVVQELDGKNSYAVNNTFFGETNTKGTSVLAETGVNVQLGKLAIFGGLNWQDGGAQKSFFGGQVGLRYTF